MLAAVKRFLSELTGAGGPVAEDGRDERLAAAALLYHVVAIDGVVDESEAAALRQALMSAFNLDAAEADRLASAGEAADKESVDLYSFTSVLKARMDEAGRERVVGLMWDMVYADGSIDEFEDNTLWRVAELLGISSRDRIRLKKAAQQP